MNILSTFRKPYLSFIFATTLLTFSCTSEQINNEEPIQNSSMETSSSIIQKEVTNKDLKNKFIAFKNSKTTKNEINGVEFDTEHIYEVALDENSPSLYMANQIGLDEKNSENYAFGAVKTKDGFSKALIVKTTRVNENLYQIDYLDDNFNVILTTVLNSADQSINLNYGKNYINQKGCGQATADCLGDVYSNHGWVSVWATVQSAFLPVTALALAGACAISEC